MGLSPDDRQTTIQDLVATFRSSDRALFDYLDWLETRFEAREPHILAFVPEEGRFVRLRREARQLLARYPEPTSRPPLFGLLIGAKDIFHVDGFVTRAGSRLPAGLLQGPEAACVTALRRAGTLILGKTATTEFAYFGPGPTRNPRQPEHTPGGSSSGSAAAVAAELCLFAFGTQTIGSISRPAAFCGVVGFKPSFGRISTDGIIPLSPSLDHAGYFTQSAGDAEWMASFLCAGWRDLPPDGRRPVLGIPAGPYLEHAEATGQTQFEQDCRRLSAAGFDIRTVAVMPDFEIARQQHQTLMASEAAGVHARWFYAHASLYHPKTAELIRSGQAAGEEAVAAARAGRVALREHLISAMDTHEVDVWISPSAPGPAPRGLESTGNPVMNLPWTNAGLPTLSVPTGTDGAGLPMALQLAGRWQDDERLLQHGRAIEAALS